MISEVTMTEVTDLTMDNLRDALVSEGWTKLSDSNLEVGCIEGYKSKRLNAKYPYVTLCEFYDSEQGFIKIYDYSDKSRSRVKETYNFSDKFKATITSNSLKVELK